MTTAKFTIDGDPSTPPGYDATAAQVLTLQLEDLPPLDAWDVQYSVTQSTSGAPALVFSPVSGKPATPAGTVDVTMPGSGIHSYVLTCVVNTGKDANGRVVEAYTYSRLVAIRSVAALRKITPAERTEYDATYGWSEAQNETVVAIDAVAAGALTYGGAPPAIAAAGAAGAAATPSRSDHTHAHGSQTDGTMHAAVVASSTSGFMTGADKQILDDATATATPGKLCKRSLDGNGDLAIGTLICDAMQIPAGVSFTSTQLAHASAGGNVSTWTGQNAASGAFDGGGWLWQGGARGGANNHSGYFRWNLGLEDDAANESARAKWYSDAGNVELYTVNGEVFLRPSGAMTISSVGGNAIVVAGANFLQTPTNITGSRGGNAALASLLTELAARGIITDGTSA